MKKKSVGLVYKQYDEIQGKDPIFISAVLSDRIRNQCYAESTMKAIVGLLKKFVNDFELCSEGRNKRYAVSFVFQPWGSLSGPVLYIADAIEERAVAVIVWNHGKPIVDYANDEFEELKIKTDCSKSIACVREKLNLRNNQLWGELDRDIITKRMPDDRKDLLSKYDLRWHQIDPSGEISPIEGLNAIVQDQLASYLSVPITWLVKKKTTFKEDGLANVNWLGIVRADANDVCAELGIKSLDSWGGANLRLENGKTIHITKSQKMYLSEIATAWLIDRVKQDPEYDTIRKIGGNE